MFGMIENVSWYISGTCQGKQLSSRHSNLVSNALNGYAMVGHVSNVYWKLL